MDQLSRLLASGDSPMYRHRYRGVREEEKEQEEEEEEEGK